MLHSYSVPIIAEANHIAASKEGRTLALRRLRDLPLADFCQLLLEAGTSTYAGLKQLLPRMPSDEDQKKWTGNSGAPLMIKSCNVARLLDIISYRCSGSGLSGKLILDYGCGWGRLMRLMYYFSDFDRVYGIDPWDRSLAVCRECGIPDTIAICEALPMAIPFEEKQFNFAFSYSVFTHLSEAAARAVLRACRRALAPDGVYVITIRPQEFWTMRKAALGEVVFEQVMREHCTRGFAFTPGAFADDRESATYGEASISPEFMKVMAQDTGWSVESFDRDMMEPYQLMVVLRPA